MHLQHHLECRVSIISTALELRVLAIRLVAIQLRNPRNIRRDQDPRRTQQAQHDLMTLMEVRPLLLRIHEARDKSSRVGDGELQGRCSGSLVVTGGVVRVPREDARNGSVHARGHEEGHAVLHLGVCSDADDCVADDGDGERGEHDWAAQSDSIAKERHDDREECRDRVWDDCP